MVDELRNGVLTRDRRALAKAITLLESNLPEHRPQARMLLDSLLPHTGGSLRIGVTGNPGVGKSTFIEALGTLLITQGRRVAVLAVDPSSTLGGGSILADKTRMDRLSSHPDAFIRPSPSGGTLGGVTTRTREAVLLCEAAGFDVVIVETVGVGQSEVAVADMTDVFVLLQLPNAGDDLQAMKKGVVEMAHLLVVNKIDLDRTAAKRAAGHIAGALQLQRRSSTSWLPEVLTISALTGDGIDTLWTRVLACQAALRQTGEWDRKRGRQALAWMWQLVDEGLRERVRRDPAIQANVEAIAAEVAAGKLPGSAAATRVLQLITASEPLI